MDNVKHNGWHNYATWRIALEVFDNEAEYRAENEESYDDISDLAEVLKDSVEEMIDNAVPNDMIVAGWANAFIDDVDWYEIAEHIVEEAPQLIKTA